MFDTFHFLRPEWLLAIPVVLVLLILLLKRSSQSSGWEDVCDPALLQYQLAQQNLSQKNTSSRASSWHLFNWLIASIFLIGIFALSGPTWEKKEQPVFQQGNALVIILDLSLSMNATDLKPSRIERAKLKLIDILQKKTEGQTALIAFAGDAHTVSPLTIDNKTIMSLLPALDSSIMPLNGSYLVDALTMAKELFKNAGFAQGDILLLSDGVESRQEKALTKNIKSLHKQGYRFSVIGVGTAAGSPIPRPGQGGFIKAQSGQVVLTKLAPDILKKLAATGGGQYHKLSLDDSDFQSVLEQKMDHDNKLVDQNKQLEQWIDTGSYFTLLIIPLALFGFRKGLFSFVLCLSLQSFFIIEPAHAENAVEQNAEIVSKPVSAQFNSRDKIKNHWKNLWSTADQQAQKSFDANNYKLAADKFSDNNWKATANYRAGNFKDALAQYSQSDDANNLYNKGNTLAHMGKNKDAIKAYSEALKKVPVQDKKFENDIIQNLEYIKKLQAQKKKQESQKDSDKKDKDSDSPSENQNQEQKNSSDDASKSNNSDNSDSKSDESKGNNSEGDDAKGEQSDDSESGQKDEQKSDSGSEEKDSNSSSQSTPEQDDKNKPQSPDEAKSLEKSNPTQEAENHSMQPDEKEGAQQTSQQSSANDVLSQLNQEEQQSLKQWLQRIPDNPGELLRVKFRNNTLLKQRKSDSSETQYEGNPW